MKKTAGRRNPSGFFVLIRFDAGQHDGNRQVGASLANDICQLVFVPSNSAGHLGHQTVHGNDFNPYVNISPAIEKGVLYVEIILNGKIFPELYFCGDPVLYKINLIICTIRLKAPGEDGLLLQL